MSDAPNHSIPPLFIHPWTRYMLAHDLSPGSCTSGVWPAANRALYLPFYIPCKMPIRRVWWHNGGTANGNVDFGIFSKNGSKIFSTGSVAQAGINAPQYVTVDQWLDTDTYFMALALSSGTGTIFRSTGVSLTDCRLVGMLQEAAALPLPNAMTPAALAAVFVPLCGITTTDSGY